jgi:drug/metabolite transporter (DMT)-like permease
MTPIGALLSFLFLGEKPQIFHLVGFALIFTGVLLSSKPPQKKDATK